MLPRYHHPPNVPRIRTRLHELLDEGRFSDTTRQKYRAVIDQWIVFAGPDPRGWTRNRMMAFRSQLIATKRSGKTIETYMASLRYVSKWFAKTTGGEDFTDIPSIRLPASTAPPRSALTQDQATRLLLTCVDGRPTLFDHRDLALMLIGLDTGMRRNSLVSMKLEKLGESQGATTRYPSIEVPVKGRDGDKTFKVPLSPTAMLALESWHERLGVQRGPVFRRILRTAKGPKITGRGISGISIYNMIEKRAKQAGISHVHPHLLRHTFVSWRMGVPPYLIASVTGHAVQLITRQMTGVDMGAMESYVDLEKAGEEGRLTTPPWLAQLAKQLLRQVNS